MRRAHSDSHYGNTCNYVNYAKHRCRSQRVSDSTGRITPGYRPPLSSCSNLRPLLIHRRIKRRHRPHVSCVRRAFPIDVNTTRRPVSVHCSALRLLIGVCLTRRASSLVERRFAGFFSSRLGLVRDVSTPLPTQHSQHHIKPHGPSSLNMAPAYELRAGGDVRNTRQNMAELKLRRLNELNMRLREDLERPRVKVSEASIS